jgi:hypothetical protein
MEKRMMSAKIALTIALLSYARLAGAQCSNSATPSCNVYEQCFAKYCPCDNDPNEYFLSYGQKYCQRFLDNANFSDAGKAWRDKTLVCLQESIVPKLDISEQPVCNCGGMKNFAFQSHVSCYTSPQHSICDLPVADIKEIGAIIDIKDAFSSDGWKQMKEVVKVCSTSAKDGTRRSLWAGFAKILNQR